MRIIEESYDAVACEFACSKHVSAVRTRQRYNLDLGALDSFPQSVKRFVAQKYRSVTAVCSSLIFRSSVLSLLPQICMEILLALDRAATLSDKVCIHRQVGLRKVFLPKANSISHRQCGSVVIPEG